MKKHKILTVVGELRERHLINDFNDTPEEPKRLSLRVHNHVFIAGGDEEKVNV